MRPGCYSGAMMYEKLDSDCDDDRHLGVEGFPSVRQGIFQTYRVHICDYWKGGHSASHYVWTLWASFNLVPHMNDL